MLQLAQPHASNPDVTISGGVAGEAPGRKPRDVIVRELHRHQHCLRLSPALAPDQDHTVDERSATACIAPLMETRLADAKPIRVALQRIPEQYRVPLQLVSDGYGHKDIAAVMGLNVNTVKTRVHRARTRFRQVYTA